MIDSTDYPYVTIGLCIKNEERHIARCLDSIFNLDYPKNRLQIIIVDNKSTDNTMKICHEKLAQADISYRILRNEGKGLGISRQMVAENASGEYVVWIDGDSAAVPTLVKSQVEFMRNDPRIGVGIAMILAREGASAIERLDTYQFRVLASNAVRKDKTPPMPSLGSITRVKVIKEVGGYDVSLFWLSDTDLFWKILSKGLKIHANPRAFIYHYMSYSSFTRLFRRSYLSGYASCRLFDSSGMLRFVLGDSLLRVKSFYGIVRYGDSAVLLLPLTVIIGELGYLLGHFFAPINRKE